MKRIFFHLLMAFAISSCMNPSAPNSETKQVADEALVVQNLSDSLCYQYQQNGDTVLFRVEMLGDSVKGNLSYAFKEKDKSSGIFHGKRVKDKIIGEYRFESEGIESERQLVFLIQENALLEGYGALNAEGNAFLAPEHLDYNTQMPLSKVSCSQNNQN